ncbi:E3 ubiquitin-protein ligase SHPRH [Trichoplax sp. H2]|nr:E3 ubiquitin-protein ligase SHPRH [Trichoplax sp. H2]|eukprot:RDD45665.1 E3 ubiquitin-protein ligase SHPRH [Trichoplax sp. H2]
MKRKNSTVRKILPEQQQQLSWNMASLANGVADDDDMDDLPHNSDSSATTAKKQKVVSDDNSNDEIDQFSIHLHVNISKVETVARTFEIGQFKAQITLDGTFDLQAIDAMILSFGQCNDNGLATIQLNDNYERKLLCSIHLPTHVLNAMDILVNKYRNKNGNAASLYLHAMETDKQFVNLTLSLFLESPAFAKLPGPSASIANTGASHLIQNVPVIIRHFLGGQLNSEDFEVSRIPGTAADADEIYRKIKSSPYAMKSDIDDRTHLQHQNLLPTLRPYQARAVQWMLNRERSSTSVQDRSTIHSLWRELKSIDGKQFYFNPYSSRITISRFNIAPLPPGGILADEMGLGKTVEVLACVLLNERPTNILENSTSTDVSGNNLAAKSCNDVCERSDVAYQYDCSDSKDADKVDEGKNTSTLRKRIHSQLKDSITRPSNGNSCKLTCICGGLNEDEDSEQPKTAQCQICSIWQHPKCVRPDFDYCSEYICPHCIVRKPTIASGATLIISPSSIAYQWKEEIMRHIDKAGFKAMIYKGVAKEGFINPSVLANYDIIITTYETLQQDIYHIADNHGNVQKQLRFTRRYLALPSPLPCINWWRICLDEAQMVENVTARAAEMVLKLQCIHRWCVTGTPVQRGIEDLYGLALFLGLDPIHERVWWRKVIYENYIYGNLQPLVDAFASIFWRSVKSEIVDEIQLPEQSSSMNWLKLSPIESHFYQRQHEECSTDALKVMNRIEQKSEISISSLDKVTFQKMLNPLLRLRQACCHPQAVTSSGISLNRGRLTMDQILESMIKKSKTECEEAQRQIIFALNGITDILKNTDSVVCYGFVCNAIYIHVLGLAGVHVMKEELVEAVDRYREAIAAWEEYKDRLHTDSIQKIHTLHNLNDILKNHPEIAQDCGRTIRESRLDHEVEQLKLSYLIKFKTATVNSREILQQSKQTISELKSQLDEIWYLQLLEKFEVLGLENQLITRLQQRLSTQLTQMYLNSTEMAGSFTNITGLKYVATMQLDAITESREALLKLIYSIDQENFQLLVSSAADCHLRPAKLQRRKKCKICEANRYFEEYESHLFLLQRRSKEKSSNLQENLNRMMTTKQLVSRADSEIERTLKAIVAFAKSYVNYKDDDDDDDGGLNASQSEMHTERFEGISDDEHQIREMIRSGRHFLSLLDTYKKEFNHIRALWMSIDDHIAALDELEMAKTRLRKQCPGEEVPDSAQTYIIPPGLVEQTRFRFLSDLSLGKIELKKKLGQLSYLENLSKARNFSSHENEDSCPICVRKLGKEWTVLGCGHCYCYDCTDVMIKKCAQNDMRQQSVKCPLCRIKTAVPEISYASLDDAASTSEASDIKVEGSHSTKIEAVARKLLSFLRKDDQTKFLIFSSWTVVLNLISQALTDNKINHINAKSGQNFQDSITKFKYDTSIPVLLLPLKSGANGLNLIEATHVILIEPVLNPAQELQAIGRVHRIGQTKSTEVHRFIIKGTVEERIMDMSQSKKVKKSSRKRGKDEVPITIDEYKSLFLKSDELL